MVPSCSEGGVLGSLAGTIGSMQATEVLKEIMGIGNSLSGNLMLYDALETEFRKISLKRDSNCPLCGNHPTISDLSIHTAA
jgi:adenylyltransferase/sulfurtransferase